MYDLKITFPKHYPKLLHLLWGTLGYQRADRDLHNQKLMVRDSTIKFGKSKRQKAYKK